MAASRPSQNAQASAMLAALKNQARERNQTVLWVAAVLNFSGQYDSKRWKADNLVGEPSVYVRDVGLVVVGFFFL